MLVLSLFFGTLAACLIPDFICKFLYIYAVLKCIFMQYVMVDRKLCGIFGFSCMFANTSYLITLRFSAYFMFWEISRKRNQKQKKPHFCRFCLKTSLFVANKTLIFSDLYLYRVIYTPPPRFWHSQGGSALIRIFLFFYFLFFVKYSDFLNSAFLPNFEHFPEYHIYFWFCISFRDIHFRLFSCVMERFM